MIVEVCSHCGAIVGPSSHGHADAVAWRWKRMEYVSVDETEVVRLRESLDQANAIVADLLAEVERLESQKKTG